jgi:hypothetical protein
MKPSSLFTIEETKGQMTTSMLSEGLINYEDTSKHELIVVVEDGGGLRANSLITIDVIDVNEPPEFIFSGQTATMKVKENSVGGTVVGQMKATDPDNGQTLSFRFKGGVHPHLLIIECDGTITVRSNGDILDYETLNSFIVQVIVYDDGQPLVRKSIMDVIVNVVDVNEEPMIYNGIMNVDENSMIGK